MKGLFFAASFLIASISVFAHNHEENIKNKKHNKEHHHVDAKSETKVEDINKKKK